MQNYFQQNGLTTVFVGRMPNVRQGTLEVIMHCRTRRVDL